MLSKVDRVVNVGVPQWKWECPGENWSKKRRRAKRKREISAEPGLSFPGERLLEKASPE